jgi:hypothetical protein
MAKRGTSKRGSGSGNRGIVGYVWNPFRHLFMATGESAQSVGTAAGKVVRNTLSAAQGVGDSFAKHSNQALRNMTRRRKNSRRNSRRKNSRRSA